MKLLISLLVALARAAPAPTASAYFAANATSHLEHTYWPLWSALFLEEGTDAAYPMPAAADVPDLLAPLRGVKGLAVKTDPGTTVSEGQGYAMLVAGMRNDTASSGYILLVLQYKDRTCQDAGPSAASSARVIGR